MNSAPLVSVIIPAFRAGETIKRSLSSVEAAGLPLDRLQVIVASDDGTNYADLLGRASHLTFAPVGPVRTGPGAARNRALAEAYGQYVAFLDADDTWSPGYLADLLPLAATTGLAFGQSAVIDHGTEILRVPGTEVLDFAAMGASGASFHPLVRRDWAGPFRDAAAQDVFNTVEVLALAGGRAPVGTARYEIQLSTESFTTDDGFSVRVADAYERYRADIQKGQSRVPPSLRAEAAGVFSAKLGLNADFMRDGDGLSYYAYVATRLSKPEAAS